MSLFSAPSSGGGDACKPKDVHGHLLIVKAKGIRGGVKTDYGVSDAVEVDVADVDTGHSYRNALWFGVGLINGLKDQIGKPVLAHMGQGTAKVGQSAPWLLLDATEDQAAVAKAEAWLAANPSFLNSTFSAPAAQAAPAPAAQAAPPVAQPTLPANAADDPAVAALLQKMLEKQQAGAQ